VNSKRQRQFRFFAGNPCLDTFKDLSGTFDRPIFLKLYDWCLPSLTTNKVIRVPKLDERFTVENLAHLPSLSNWRERDFSESLK
jgi:hypothetical protein